MGWLHLLACIRFWIQSLAQQGVGVRGALDFHSRDGRGRFPLPHLQTVQPPQDPHTLQGDNESLSRQADALGGSRLAELPRPVAVT